MEFTVNRRALLAGATAAGLAGTLAACGGEKDQKGGSGSFTFTDDRGEEVKLDAAPTGVVAYSYMAAALTDFGFNGFTGVFGPTLDGDGNLRPEVEGLDKDAVEVIGNAFGEFDVEKYAGLEPQVLLDHYYNTPESLWYIPEDSKDKILKLAPQAALNVDDGSNTLADIIQRHEDLAKALGADVEADSVAEQKEEFDAAVEALKTAAADKPLKVLACSAAEDRFYASVPASSNDLRFFEELGVEFIVPDSPDEQGYFEDLSWENAGKYEADVLLLDARAGVALQPDELSDFPTWKALKAVQADQIVPWFSEPRYSWSGSAGNVQALADMIAKGDAVA
ncbi:ABC transporter substrate-binding protein [Salininema proteolyticum]|uniref:ABC transporter substrate-binding protein n=1 Tax=Salininema proteolyticum TaxID=1607685 RepID=A0ABV8TW01_9ACTN